MWLRQDPACACAFVLCSSCVVNRPSPLPPSLLVSCIPSSPQCIGRITGLMLRSAAHLQQPALTLMAESGDEELLRLTLDQIGSMTAVSLRPPGCPAYRAVWKSFLLKEAEHIFTSQQIKVNPGRLFPR